MLTCVISRLLAMRVVAESRGMHNSADPARSVMYASAAAVICAYGILAALLGGWIPKQCPYQEQLLFSLSAGVLGRLILG